MTNEQKIAKTMRDLLEKRKNHVKRNKEMNRMLNPFMPYVDGTTMDIFMITPEQKTEQKPEVPAGAEQKPMPPINLEVLNCEQWSLLHDNGVLQQFMGEYRTFDEYHTPNTAKATKLLKALRDTIEAGGDVEASLGKFFKQDLPNFVE